VGGGMGILIVSTNISSSAAPAMSYCINPTCPAPDKNSPTTNFCMSCGAKILLKDRYRALSLLGQGGFGKTFKAVDEDQPRKPLCVIKQFAFSNNHPETRQIALKLFYEEAQHLEALGKHDQIPELLAYFDVEGQPYLVQQFIDGQDLEQELATAGTFNQAKIRELLESLLPVLDFLHHQSPPVIHRDIKPANIIRRRSDGGLVLVDFGAAKQVTQSMLAKPGTVIGSPEYMSPEQVRGRPTFASDIYSLGVTCLYLLTQVSPFDLFDLDRYNWVWRNYLVNNPVDENLGKVLDKMIANFLSQRYQSAVEILDSSGHGSKAIVFNRTILPLIPRERNNRKNSKFLGHWSKDKCQFESVKLGIINATIKISNISFEAEGFTEELGNGIELSLVYIPPGGLWMGSPENERRPYDETPVKQVNVDGFYMGKYLITQLQYHAVMGYNPSVFKDSINLPVDSVSWHDAIEFCKKIGGITRKKYTLPTEAQWEYACRSDTNTPFYFGDLITTDLVNYCGDYAYGNVPTGKYRRKTTQVGIFPPNAFGLYDMHGNLWEWCLDEWVGCSYPHQWTKDSNNRVVRGGSWVNYPDNCRSAFRGRNSLNYRSDDVGFRIILPTS
jgi:formylglycine-generating enzyme required for sulfatase activity